MTREEAIEILWQYDVNFEPHPAEKVMHAIDMAIEALSAEAEQVTGKLKNHNDFLLKSDSDECKEQKSKLDLISLPDGTEIDIDEESYEIGYTHGQMADRPTGEWVECESNHIEKIYLCSNCQNHEAWGETEKTPYCPNCGAKMGGNNHD